VINTTPQQSFVAGFREGVKMCTDRGKPIAPENFNRIWPTNLRILTTWCTIGADVDNGKFAMLGARMGSFYTVVDHKNYDFDVSDLNGMADYFHSTVQPANIDRELEMFGNSLRQQLDMPIAEYDEADSRFYRFVMPQHVNRKVQDREYK
jgi:hypothetical protein